MVSWWLCQSVGVWVLLMVCCFWWYICVSLSLAGSLHYLRARRWLGLGLKLGLGLGVTTTPCARAQYCWVGLSPLSEGCCSCCPYGYVKGYVCDGVVFARWPSVCFNYHSVESPITLGCVVVCCSCIVSYTVLICSCPRYLVVWSLV